MTFFYVTVSYWENAQEFNFELISFRLTCRQTRDFSSRYCSILAPSMAPRLLKWMSMYFPNRDELSLRIVLAFPKAGKKTENTNNAKDISVKIWLPTGNLNEDSLGINFFLGCKCFYCVFSRFTEIWEETQTCEHVAWCVVSWSSFSQVRHSRNAGLKCKWRLLCTLSALHIRNRLPAFITTAIK